MSETGLVLATDSDSLLESEADLDPVLETESDSNLMLVADLDLHWVLPANGSDKPDSGWATDTVELMLATDLVDLGVLPNLVDSVNLMLAAGAGTLMFAIHSMTHSVSLS